MIPKKYSVYFPVFLVLFEFTVYLANDMIMPGMIQVIKDFGVSEAYVPGSFTAFLAGGACLQIFLGPISDRYGRRKVMIFGAFFFFISTIIILLSSSIEEFIMARFLQGMGLCYIGVVGYASIQEMFPEKKAVQLIALMAIVALVAPLGGPLLGGFYTQFFHWHGVFIIIGILSFIALIGLYLYMPETAHLRLSPQHVLSKNPDLKDLPPLNLKNFMVNYFEILTNKQFLLGTFAMSFAITPLLAWISISPVILITKAKLTYIQYGLCQIPIFGGLILGNIILQKKVHATPLNKLIAKGSIIMVIGLFLCCILPLAFGQAYALLIFALSFYCYGVAISNAALTRMILYSSAVAKGSVSAILSLISSGIFALGAMSMALVYKNQNNIHFGLFCAFLGVVFVPLIFLFLRGNKTIEK